jgi:uncharacterized membrane protein YfcA
MLTDIAVLLTGLVVGAMNAIAGGGMLLGFPILIALGIPPIVANATTPLAIGPGQISSAFGYREYLRKVPLRYAWLLMPIAAGASAGALLLRHTPADHFAKIIPLLLLFGVGLFALQPVLHIHFYKHIKGRKKSVWPLVWTGLAMLPISFYGGFFGVGYGFMMLAFLSFTNLKDAHLNNALKNVSAIIVCFASLLTLTNSGLINWRIGLFMAAGCLVGGYVGARSAQKVSSHSLRIFISLIGLCSVVYLALHEY